MSSQSKDPADKLGQLLLKGWTMLNEYCSIESCKCPLMRNINGQKYCCNCESWVFDNQKKREKKKFTELICVPNKKQAPKAEKPKQEVQQGQQKNLRQVLDSKLDYLNEALQNETDLHQIEIISNGINLILDAYKKIDMIENKHQ